MKRVIIVGAGIVGLVLAKELASMGIEATVYDSNRDVADGAERASGILSKKGLERTGIDYAGAVLNALYGAVIHAGMENLKIKAGNIQAYVLSRSKLARICYKEAKDAGAAVILGKRLGKEDVLSMNNTNTVIVGADGVVSTVASAFGFPKISEYVLTYKATYNDARVADKHIVDLFFEEAYARGFFGWTAPYSSTELEVGIGTSHASKRNSLSAFESFTKTHAIASVIDGAERTSGYASIIPLEARKKTVFGNVMLVGDAAGQVKATTGGGLIFGIACSKIAASTIKNHIEKGMSLKAYEKAWRSRYGLDLKLHGLLHAYYSGLTEKRFEAFIKLARIFGAESFFSKYGDMDSPSLMIKRLLLRSKAS